MSLRAGDEIGEWLVEGTLGEGSMGVVYRCRDLEFRSIPAAIKVSKSKLSPRARKRFIREAELLRELDHEAIIKVRNQGEDERRQLSWFAMELLEGITFRERIQHPTPLSVGMALSLFARLADGLAYAHERHIFHRDLKPSNLYLCLDGSVRILDFGVGLAVEWSPLTATDQQMGTYAYMPPEVFRGRSVDPALGDVYGLGLVLYEVLMGEEIFLQPLTQMTTMKMNATPMDLGEGYPDDLRELLIRATDPEPETRLESMQEFADRVLELSLEFPAEPDDASFPEDLRLEVISRSAHSASAQETLIPGGGGPTTAAGSVLNTGVHQLAATQVATPIPSAPPDSWLLEGSADPISRARVLDLIVAEKVSATTLIARPGSSWRQIRYHPNFRAYFTSGSDASRQIEARRQVRRSNATLNEEAGRRRLWPILVAAMGGLLVVGGVAISRIPETPEEVTVGQTAPVEAIQETLLAALAERSPSPSGDPAALQSEGLAALEVSTRAAARTALSLLSQAGQLDTGQAETFAGLAEAAVRLEETDGLAELVDLSLAYARSLDDGLPSVARAELAVELSRGHRSEALSVGQRCKGDLRCDAMLAAAGRDQEALDALVAAHPEVPGLKLVQLEVRMAEGAWGEILDTAPALQEVLPNEPLPLRAQALAASAVGDWGPARAAAVQAMVLEPGWLDMAHLLGRLSLGVDDDPAAAAGQLQALTASSGFADFPDRAAVWRDLAASALAREDSATAIKAADAAAEVDPSDPICRLQRAWALHQKGDRTGFMSQVSEISLGSYTGTTRARLGLSFARMLATAGLNRQALMELTAASEADSGDAEVWLALSGVQASLGDSKQAAMALEAAALRDSTGLRQRDPLNTIWSPPVDLRPRAEQLKTLISRDISLTAKESALTGLLHWLRGDSKEAQPLLAEAIADGSMSPAVYAAMGQLMMEQRRYSDALEPLGRAVELSPGQPVLTAMHSTALGIIGRRRDASVQLAGLSDRLDDPALVRWKARGLQAAGEEGAARSLLTRYLRGQQRDPAAWALMLSL